MTDTKHTPGPWEYVPATENHGPYVANVVGNTVCDCYMLTDPLSGPRKPVQFCYEMAPANARLIAAAPELLEALMQTRAFILSEYEDEGAKALDGEVVHRNARPIWGTIHDAIAKAEGRS